jgi:hypothetical protein
MERSVYSRHECVICRKNGKRLPGLGYKVRSQGASRFCIFIVNNRQKCATASEKRREDERIEENRTEQNRKSGTQTKGREEKTREGKKYRTEENRREK